MSDQPKDDAARIAAMTGKAHPLADTFPMHDADQLAELKADILKHGLRLPIVANAAGVILDGRNRWKACQELNSKRTAPPAHARPQVKFVDVTPAEEMSMILSLNAQRRHQSTSRRAMQAALWATLGAKNSPRLNQQQRADLANVSVATLKQADYVLLHGTPDEVAEVMTGKRKVSNMMRALERRVDMAPKPADERRQRQEQKVRAAADRKQREEVAARLEATRIAAATPPPEPAVQAEAGLDADPLAGTSVHGYRKGMPEVTLSCEDALADPAPQLADYEKQTKGMTNAAAVAKAQMALDDSTFTPEEIEYLARKILARVAPRRLSAFLAEVKLKQRPA